MFLQRVLCLSPPPSPPYQSKVSTLSPLEWVAGVKCNNEMEMRIKLGEPSVDDVSKDTEVKVNWRIIYCFSYFRWNLCMKYGSQLQTWSLNYELKTLDLWRSFQKEHQVQVFDDLKEFVCMNVLPKGVYILLNWHRTTATPLEAAVPLLTARGCSSCTDH